MTNDTEIDAKEQRVTKIIERLESEELGLAEAKTLRDEAQEHLTDLRTLVDLEGGNVREYGE
jgi:hypothetical protein